MAESESIIPSGIPLNAPGPILDALIQTIGSIVDEGRLGVCYCEERNGLCALHICAGHYAPYASYEQFRLVAEHMGAGAQLAHCIAQAGHEYWVETEEVTGPESELDPYLELDYDELLEALEEDVRRPLTNDNNEQ